MAHVPAGLLVGDAVAAAHAVVVVVVAAAGGGHVAVISLLPRPSPPPPSWTSARTISVEEWKRRRRRPLISHHIWTIYTTSRFPPHYALLLSTASAALCSTLVCSVCHISGKYIVGTTLLLQHTTTCAATVAPMFERKVITDGRTEDGILMCGLAARQPGSVGLHCASLRIHRLVRWAFLIYFHCRKYPTTLH